MAYKSVNQARRRGAIHESFLKHRNYRYFKLAVILSAAAIAGYFLHDPVPRPNGGTWYGYTMGTISALLIVWLTALGVRKRNISPGRWSLKGWTSAHVYLGLSLIILGTLHTGFQFGWNVHTLAYGAMMVVIVSGLFGIYFYANVPTKMGRNREEMTREQMVQELNAIDRQLTQQAQPLATDLAVIVSKSVTAGKISGGVLARLSGKMPGDPTDQALTKLRKALPYQDGAEREALTKVIATLERKQDSLTRARQHIRYKTLLELWLYVHVPTTFLLLAALIAHIISVFFYW